jgi:RimJ/RimL family protein N-acetyltransferase
VVDLDTWRSLGPGGRSRVCHCEGSNRRFCWRSRTAPHRLEEPQAVAGYWVAAWARNEGIATKALTLVTDRAFQHVRLQVVELQTMIGNRASERVAEKAGFDLIEIASDAAHPIADGQHFNVKRWALRQA